jgi:hypothetical protein
MQHPDPTEAGRHLFQRRDQRSVELDREDVGAGRRQGDGERAEPGADLDDPVTGPDAGVRDDRARQVGIDQEVLTQRLGGPDAVPAGEISDRSGTEPRGWTVCPGGAPVTS